ncbi:FtsX-like permease family protein [Virgibacillus kimchii]
MNINQLIFRNLKKNLKHYYLYVFALIFISALYFSFVTLQYDPAMDETTGSVRGAAALRAASVFLIIIVGTFLVYANNIFIKRRSKEIGLFQLIGMTKGKIFSILSVENLLLYFGSLFVGVLLGFAMSRFIMMILLKITGIEEVAALQFSMNALVQTLIVFAGIYGLIMILNYVFIRRQSILSLFQVVSTSETKVQRMSFFQVIIGVLGIALIVFGYYLSTELFGGNFTTMIELYGAMLTILGSVILGTYLFYKGSVSFIFHLIRKQKDGYLYLKDVLSLSSIMFRMKSNAILLTVITTVSALAIGLLSLTYITYYSAEKSAEEAVPNHFSIPDQADAIEFGELLQVAGIPYAETKVNFIEIQADLSEVIGTYDEDFFEPDETSITIISDEKVEEIDVAADETVFINSLGPLEEFMQLADSGEITLSGENSSFEMEYMGQEDIHLLPPRLTGGGFPVAVVDQHIYEQLESDRNPDDFYNEFSVYVGFDIDRTGDLEFANELFRENFIENAGYASQLLIAQSQKQTMGLFMFIVGFLGLSFLITSGCILYFKQMDESEEEKGSYTILRKLGFTQADMVKGIRIKQLFNFGIPLIVGLSHSYFAVKSGWFFFGTELWTPMIIVMLVYTALYSIFGLLSVLYYKQVIKNAL